MDSSPLKDERGNLVVELALVLPMLLFMVFASLEYAQVLDYNQWASQISREVASIAYRKCSALRGRRLTACLRTRVFDVVDLNTSQLAPNAEFIVAAFQINEDGDAAVRLRMEDNKDGLAGNRAHFEGELGFTEANLNRQIEEAVEGSPGMALVENKILIIATAYFPYDGMITASLPNYVVGKPSIVHSTTIM